MPQVADAAIKASRSLKTPQYRTRAPPRVGGWRWASSPQLPDNRCSSLPSAAHTRKQGGRAHAQLRGTGHQVNDNAGSPGIPVVTGQNSLSRRARPLEILG
jgi:hypothetical protein